MLKLNRIGTFICLIYMINNNECANILAVFPIPSISHQIVFRSLTNELVKRGHQVTVITTDPAYLKKQTPHNLTEIDVHDISYDIWNKLLAINKGKESEGQSSMKFIFEMLSEIFEAQVKSYEVQKLIHNKNGKKFDLIFVESAMRPAIAFSAIYKAPVIEISSFGPFYATFDMIGAATNPLVYPMVIRQKINNLTLWEKISELYLHYKHVSAYADVEKNENKITHKYFGRDIPTLRELRKNVDMVFLNIHPMWDSNRPVPANVVYLGGLHQKPSNLLPHDLKSYLDSSENGVIFMSFGTNVKPSILPTETLKIFTSVFSQLSYNVLLKWDSDEIPGRSKNVKLSKWFPQSDLLKHPNVKLFITQGGLQSTDEAISAGVPLIGVPVYADQWFNVEMYVRHKIGVKLSLERLTEDILRDAIEEVVNNTSYRENVVKLRSVMHDQPQSALDKAVWWSEHVMRHGSAAHLRSVAAHMHWTEYYAIDLLLLITSLLIPFIILIIFVSFYASSKLKHYRIRIKTSKLH